MFLSSVCIGRDNNLNAIRFAAAAAVLVSHAFPIALGIGTDEPTLLGHSIGALAVYVFFALSGFLIAGSWERRPSAADFLRARAQRIFPGLIVSLVVVALLMGPVVTELPLSGYLGAADTWSFLIRNATLALPQYTLPGVFEGNPFPMVEGSIWTLIHEVLCYAMILSAGMLGLLSTRRVAAVTFAAYVALLLLPAVVDLPGRLVATHRLSQPFMIGAALWIWRDRVPFDLGVLMALSGLAWAAVGTPLAFPLLMTAIAYGVIWLGHTDATNLRWFNRIGDYSYGVYIYAFPVQGFVVWAWGGGPMVNIALSLPLTLLCAILSWHFVEKPCMAIRPSRSRLHLRATGPR